MHTIVALSTGSIHGAIAIVRISGPDAVSIADTLFHSARGAKLSSLPPRVAHFGELLDGDAAIDQVVATRYQAPRSYTGEDMVEFACHGSSFIVERLLQMAMAKGARMAEKGEFTRRAFLNGKLDLAQAEAVADLINAQTAPQTQMATMQLKGGLSKTIDTLKAQLLELSALLELELDFSEEDVEFADRSRLMQLTQQAQSGIERLLASYTSGNAVREGVRIVITGSPNAGKSSLLNALAQEEIALVSDIPGTTRDAIETTLRVNGLQFRLTDTAGLRQSADPVERMGVQRAEQRIAQAAALIVVVDATLPWEHIKRDINAATRHAHCHPPIQGRFNACQRARAALRADAKRIPQRNAPTLGRPHPTRRARDTPMVVVYSRPATPAGGGSRSYQRTPCRRAIRSAAEPRRASAIAEWARHNRYPRLSAPRRHRQPHLHNRGRRQQRRARLYLLQILHREVIADGQR